MPGHLLVALSAAGALFVAAPHALSQESPAPSANETQPPVRNAAEYNLPKSRLALKGYDPVAYFPEGGSKPAKGAKSITHEHRGVVYRFVNTSNLEAFKANPARYEPAYGGWCAWAMADGQRATIDPKSYIVKDGRLFVFFDGLFNDTRAQWLKRDHDAQVSRADTAWLEQSGEMARTPADG